MINFDDYALLRDSKNRCSLKEASKDFSDASHMQYMTESELEVINFDLVKRQYLNNLNLSEDFASSIDAIIPSKESIVFVEFKNGKVENRNIKSKIRDSLLIFLDIIGGNLTFSRQNIEFILVYNSAKHPLPKQSSNELVQNSPSRVELSSCLAKKSGEEFIQFDLERYKKLYFKSVHTYTKDEFEAYLHKVTRQ